MSVDTAPKLRRKSNLAFLIETTTGTPNIPTATAGVTNVFNAEMDYTTEEVAREPQGSLSQIQQAEGARSAKCTFETELVGAGSGSGGSPSWIPLMQACGCSLSGGVLTPVDSSMVTLTIAIWRDGRRRMMSGCQGNMKILIRRGQKARCQWEFQGVAQPVVDASNILPTYITSPIAPRAGASYTFAGQAARVADIAFDLGNEVVMREGVGEVDSNGDATGFRSAFITNRRPTYTFSPEAVPLATFDPFVNFNTSLQNAFSLTIGTATGNLFTIASQKAQLIQPPKDGNRNNIYVDDLVCLAERVSAAGQDEWSITMG